MKVLVLVAVLSVVLGSQVLADGSESRNTAEAEYRTSQPFLISQIVDNGRECLRKLGLYDGTILTEPTPAHPFEIGICFGYFEAAIQYASVFPPEVADAWQTEHAIFRDAINAYALCFPEKGPCGGWGRDAESWLSLARTSLDRIQGILAVWGIPAWCSATNGGLDGNPIYCSEGMYQTQWQGGLRPSLFFVGPVASGAMPSRRAPS